MYNINLFFHSNKNQQSNTLFTLMTNEKLIKYFRVINVDTSPNIPSYIKHVPTIMIKDNATIYSKENAFIWFARIKEWKRIYILNTFEQKQLKQINNMGLGQAIPDDKIIGFDKDTMLGTSDIFSFFNNNIANEYDGGLQHSFVGIDDIENKIFTPPLANGSYKVSASGEKLNSKLQSEMIDKFSMERQQELSTIDKAIDDFNRSTDK